VLQSSGKGAFPMTWGDQTAKEMCEKWI
jgi:hypothetical protein